MSQIGTSEADRMAQAVEARIKAIAQQVYKEVPSDRELEGLVISKDSQNKYTVKINNATYKNIMQERSLGEIKPNTIVKVKVPNNQMNNAYICGVVDGTITTYSNGGGGGGTAVNVVDRLDSTSITEALSANQGRILNDKIKNNISNIEELSSDFNSSTINGKFIKDNPVLTAADVGALPSTTVIPEGVKLYTELGQNTDGAVTQKTVTDELNNKVDIVEGKELSTNDFTNALKTKLEGISEGAEVNVQSDWEEKNSTSDAFIKNKPIIPSIEGLASETYVKNAITEETTARELAIGNLNTSLTNKIDAKYTKPANGIPKSDFASAVQTSLDKADNALPNTTKYGASLELSINNTTYVVTAQLKDQNGDNLGAAQTIDLPLESVVVSGYYDKTTKEVVLTLKDGSNIRFSVSDLIDGLASQTELNNLKIKISDIETKISEIDNSISELNNNKADKSELPTVNNGILTIQRNGTNISTFSANQSENSTVNIIVAEKTSDLLNDSDFTTNAYVETVRETLMQSINEKADINGLNSVADKVNDLEREFDNFELNAATKTELASGINESKSYTDSKVRKIYGTDTEDLTLSGLSNDIASNTQSIEYINRDTIPGINQNISSLDSSISAIRDTVSTLPTKSDYNSLNDKITGNADDIKTLTTETSTMKTSIESNTTAIQNNSTAIGNRYTKTETDNLISTVEGKIPTALSQLSEDSTHRVVTDIEKSTWNAKQSALPTTTTAGKVLLSTSTAGEMVWGSPELDITSTDVQVDGNSVTVEGVANLKTVKGNYNSESNPLATDSDIPKKAQDINALDIAYIGICETAGSTAAKVVTIKDFTLAEGVMINIYFTNDNTQSSITLNINGTGARTVYVDNSSSKGTQIKAGWRTFYYKSGWYTGKYLPIQVDYATSADRATESWSIGGTQSNLYWTAGETLSSGMICGMSTDGSHYSLKGGLVIDITGTFLITMGSGTAGSNYAHCYLYHYTSNIRGLGQTTEEIVFEAKKPIYLVGTLDGTKFTLLNANWYTQTEPTSEDGYVYLYLGYANWTDSTVLTMEHPLFKYSDGKFRVLGDGGGKLYNYTGDNVDGSMTQKAVTEELQNFKVLNAVQITSGGSNYRVDVDSMKVREGTEIVVKFDKDPTYTNSVSLEINNLQEDGTIANTYYVIYVLSYLQGTSYRANYIRFNNESWKAGDLIRLKYVTGLSNTSNSNAWIAIENITNGVSYLAGSYTISDNVLSEHSINPVQNKVVTTELNKKPNFVETEEVTITVNRLLDLIYPINSIRLSDNGNEQSFMGGTWVITGQGRTIIGAGVLGDNNYSVGDLIPAGLPNITGEGYFSTTIGFGSSDQTNWKGALNYEAKTTANYFSYGSSSASRNAGLSIDASKSNPIYGKSNTVHMNSFVTYIYKRIG